MAKKNVGNIYPYLLVDQGLKKNQASDRFRVFLAMKVAERAEIEMRYIKQLQHWINDLSIRTDLSDPSGNYDLSIRTDLSDPSDRYLNSELMAKILGSMRNEAAQVVDIRQRVYNLLMYEHGPYSKLQHLMEEEYKRHIKATEEEFHTLLGKRNNLAKTYKKYIEAHEHSSNQIETLESQLSERSRITSSRRPSSRTGPRKIDEMRDRLSRLRRQNDAETEKVASLEEELLDEESSAKHFLTTTEKRLQELETERIRLLIAEIKRYFEALQNTGPQRSPRLAVKGQQIRSLEEAETLIKVHWLDVHTNAKRDEVPNFQDMFAVTSAKSKAKTSANDSDRQPSKEDSKPDSHRDLPLAESVSTYFYYKSSSGSSVEADGDGNSVVAEVNRMQIRRAVHDKFPSQRHSEDSIETLNLPPEVRCPADISVLEPHKQYTTRMGVGGRFRQSEDCRQVAHLTEYSAVDKFVPTESDSDEENEDTVGNLRNVRVIAVEDNTPSPGGSELAFKKGQIIKQKSGANDDGLCYGWTRENMMGRKQYGYYKQYKVKLFKKSVI
ncbi:uncharacterized protein LOC123536630 isoform X2 [Mercenaria mercenaria]|uniref:uncharacterized protein LOC123536630 isoform X2 n=1 Tax=Mercenaria mercenaria TaxID=6596 RepID=UPI00234EA551|nr:uncharacterized protein LOC123536630 isoform X2 [Mercenaria mercenaria]